MNVRRVMVGGVALALAVATGCVVKVDFDPHGSDFEIVGSWTVNGEAPNADNCAAAGIERVRLVFYDGGSPFFFPELSAPCADGGFDTGQVWEWGRYETEWQAELSDGTVVRDARGRMPLVVQSPTTQANTFWDIVIEEVPVFDPRGTDDTLSADWMINGAAPSATTCDAAGIVSVDITLYPEDDADYTTGVVVASADCAAGKYDSRVDAPMGPIVADGRYRTSIDAIDVDGNVIEGLSFRFPDPLDTTLVTHAMLATADFVTRTTLTVNLGWDTDPTATMADGTCSESGVMMFDYMLTEAGGAAMDSQTEFACTESLTWGTTSELPPGTYSLWIDAKGEAGTTGGWMVTCTDMVVEAGRAEVYNCSIPFVP